MAKPISSTSQWRKLIFSKEYSDQHGYIWRVSTWKVLFWLITTLVLLVIVYSFFVPNQQGYLQDAMFYAIITVIVVIVVWVAANLVWKTRKIFVGFMLAWILILGLYMLLDGIFNYGLHWFAFHYGMTTWVVITFLASLGANKINGELTKSDVLYGLLVFIVIVVGNVSVFANGGFFAEFDHFITMIVGYIPNIIKP